MLKVTKDETGKLVIYADADIFINPTRTITVKDFSDFQREKTSETIEKLYKEYGRTLSQDDKMLSTCIVSGNFDTDDMCRQNIRFKYDGKKYIIEHLPSYLPKRLFKIKEKEVTYVKFHNLRCVSGMKRMKVDLVLELRANQLDYHFNKFGTFENALELA